MSKVLPVPVVIGTAGHIDHGKSALIEAICGTHPDRWREEKERGITLDLGYAQMAFEDGLEIGFVDVPGHERLVRKMVAGATGMGAVILVVACDDGVMPQTREHFEVLQLLGVKHALIALTKADLADEETLELIHADVEDLVAESNWEDAPMLPVSAHTGAGLEELKAALREMAITAQNAHVESPHSFRMPVQRSFALHGAGTVVTGVCATGSLEQGQELEIHPGAKNSRVRRVHIHGRDAGVAQPGLRTALNLPDLSAADCPRGTVVAAPGSLQAGSLLRVGMQLLPGVTPPKHASEIQVLAGTAAVEARIFLPPDFSADASALVDLELHEPMALVPGERLLLRRPSPSMNLGAGRFLCFAKHRLRRKDKTERDALMRFLGALDEPVEMLARLLEQPGLGEVDVPTVASRLGWHQKATADLLQQACKAGSVREMSAGRFLGMGEAGALAREVQGILAHWRAANPHRIRIPMARLRERLGKKRFPSLQKLQDGEIQVLGLERKPGLYWNIASATAAEDWLVDADRVMQVLKKTALQPPSAEDMQNETGIEVSRLTAVYELLEDQNQVVRVGSALTYSLAAVEELRDVVVQQLQAGGLEIPAIRDHFGTTRKYLMPLLEFLDERGITARRGANRILRDASAPLN